MTHYIVLVTELIDSCDLGVRQLCYSKISLHICGCESALGIFPRARTRSTSKGSILQVLILTTANLNYSATPEYISGRDYLIPALCQQRQQSP